MDIPPIDVWQDDELMLVFVAISNHWPEYRGGTLQIENGFAVVLTDEIKAQVEKEVLMRGLKFHSRKSQ